MLVFKREKNAGSAIFHQESMVLLMIAIINA